MALLPAALLIIALAAVAWFTWRGIGEYAAFKKLTDTRDRQARYRRWALNGLAFFIGGSLLILAMLGDLGCIIHQPKPFFGAFRWARAAIALPNVEPEFLGALVGGVVTVVVIATVAGASAARRGGRPKAVTIGDIEPLLPRNGAETVWTAVLSINAGIGEELFFRLTLPLLIVRVTGHAPTALIAAAIVFGLAHLYQGWVGVLAATVLGFVLTGVFLWTGNLAVPILLHAGLDLVGLVVRPTLSRLARPR